MNPIPASDFALAAPEMLLLGGTCVVLLVDLVLSDRQRPTTYFLSLVVLALTAVLAASLPDGRHLAFNGMFVVDGAARLLKLVATATVAVVFVYSRDYLIQRGLFKGEYFVLALFATLGIFVMTSAGSLLTMYLGIELLALSQYALVAFDRDSPIAAESAMKYFVLGAIASGALLYGMSLIYGLTGTLDLSEIATRLHPPLSAGVVLGLTFIVVGVAFKFGAVPFHMWLPDVYEGAPTTLPRPSARTLSASAKYASFGAAPRNRVTDVGAPWYTSGIHM